MNQRFALSALFLFLVGILALFLLSSTKSAGSGDAVTAPFLDLPDAPTIAVNWNKARAQSVTLGGNSVFSFSNGKKGETYTLILRQDASGARTVTWPSYVRWPGGTPPTITTTASKTDYLIFFYNGVNYDALGLSQNY